MSAKHTPGPWKIGIADIYQANSGDYVASVDGPNRADLIQTRNANRALVCAAPDLLEALEDLLTLVEDEGVNLRVNAYAKAKKAIAKAQGTK